MYASLFMLQNPVAEYPRMLVLGGYNPSKVWAAVAEKFRVTMDFAEVIKGPTHTKGHTFNLYLISDKGAM